MQQTKEGNKHSNGKRKETIQAGQEVLAATKASVLTERKQTDSGAAESPQETAGTGKKGKAKSKRTRSKKISSTLSQSVLPGALQSPSTNYASFEIDANQCPDQFREKPQYEGLHTSGNTARHLQPSLSVPTAGLRQGYTQSTYQNSGLGHEHLLNQQLEAPHTRLPSPGYTYEGHPSLKSQRQHDFSSNMPFSPALSTLSNNVSPTTYSNNTPASPYYHYYNVQDSTAHTTTNSSRSLQSPKKRSRDEGGDIPPIAGPAKRICQI